MNHLSGFLVTLFIATSQSLVIEILLDLIVSVINKFIQYETFQSNNRRMNEVS